jgi:hypothetical protein
MNLIEKIDSEPAASSDPGQPDRIPARYSIDGAQDGCFGRTDEYHAYLNASAAVNDVLTDSTMPDLSACQLLICRGGEIDASTALRFLDPSGTLVYTVPAAALERYAPGSRLDISLQPTPAP